MLFRSLRHRFVEHLDVELEAEGRDMARLLGSQQVTRAADLEVAHGDLEAGAELGVVGEGGEARTSFRRQLARVGIEEVRMGEQVGLRFRQERLVLFDTVSGRALKSRLFEEVGHG